LDKLAEDDLVAALCEYASLGKDLEAAKIALCLKPDMNIKDAFKIFDCDSDGVITVSEFREGLASIGLYPTSEETDLWFMRYDRLHTFNLKLSQFQQAFLPQDPYYCDMLLARPPNSRHGFRQDDCFSAETSQQLRSLLRSHFKTEGTMESIR
jgi:hypothetical protein